MLLVNLLAGPWSGTVSRRRAQQDPGGITWGRSPTLACPFPACSPVQVTPPSASLTSVAPAGLIHTTLFSRYHSQSSRARW